jgi:hypothetical protein
LLKNKPVIICGLQNEHFLCTPSWTIPTPQGLKPNFRYLREHYGNSTVIVAICGVQEYNDQKRKQMKFSEYIDYWCNLTTRSYCRENCNKGGDEFHTIYSSDPNLLYLKDWHIVKEYPNEIIYKLPVIFSDDWINSYWDQRKPNDDYRFVYMGPRGSWTPFHVDVFRSYSWSTNICGKKLWILYPPHQEPFLKDLTGKTPYDISIAVDEKLFPNFSKSTKPIRFIQEAGETVFIPSYWYHQVHNLDDTISINHNWGNACNIDLMWKFLKEELKLVETAIDDCRDTFTPEEYEEHCQLMLRSSAGINFVEFFELIQHAAQQQADHITLISSDNKNNNKLRKRIAPNYNLELFSLHKIVSILKDLLSQSSMKRYQAQGETLLEKINETLQRFLNLTTTEDVTFKYKC